MFKKRPAQVITIVSFVIAVIGIINNVFITTTDFSVMRAQQLLNPFFLDWIFSDSSINTNGHNYVNAFFHAILFLGALLFVSSGYKESRLIRFIFSIIILSNASIFLHIIVLFIFKSYFLIWVKHLPREILFMALSVGWIYLSLQVLKYLNSTRTLQREITDEPHPAFIKATNWQRFLHPLVDSIVTIAVFSSMLRIFVVNDTDVIFRYMVQLEVSWVQKYLLLVIIALRFIYYLFCETVFGFTPAKLLTQTRVIDYDGKKPPFKKVLIRTLSRLVPFEAVFFFVHGGLHDKWSETLVVKEENLPQD